MHRGVAVAWAVDLLSRDPPAARAENDGLPGLASSTTFCAGRCTVRPVMSAKPPVAADFRLDFTGSGGPSELASCSNVSVERLVHTLRPLVSIVPSSVAGDGLPEELEDCTEEGELPDVTSWAAFIF